MVFLSHMLKLFVKLVLTGPGQAAATNRCRAGHSPCRAAATDSRTVAAVLSLSGGKKIPLIAACLLHIAICGVICRPVFWSLI